MPRERVHLHLRGEALRHAEYTDGEMITTGAVLWFDRKGRFIRTIGRVFALGEEIGIDGVDL